jgi:hypothetical protein
MNATGYRPSYYEIYRWARGKRFIERRQRFWMVWQAMCRLVAGDRSIGNVTRQSDKQDRP